ncbi:MAG: hypothetical protein R3B06_26690 [Kofleriaceae bacterium]
MVTADDVDSTAAMEAAAAPPSVDLLRIDAAGSVVDPLLRFFRERQRRLGR